MAQRRQRPEQRLGHFALRLHAANAHVLRTSVGRQHVGSLEEVLRLIEGAAEDVPVVAARVHHPLADVAGHVVGAVPRNAGVRADRRRTLGIEVVERQSLVDRRRRATPMAEGR